MKTPIFILLLLAAANIMAQKPGDLVSDFGEGGKMFYRFNDEAATGMRSMVIRQDGKILLAGNLETFAGSSLVILRLKRDGSLDSGFSSDGALFVPQYTTLMGPRSMLLMQDGSILVCGESWEGKPVSGLMKFTEDGQPDSSFNAHGRVTRAFSPWGDQATALAQQKDGKILVTGAAGNLKGYHAPLLARFHENGYLDTTFIRDGFLELPPDIRSFYPWTIQIDAKGDIFLAGQANDSLMGDGDFCVIKVKADGSLDQSYGKGGASISNFGAGIAHFFSSSVLQSDGSVVVLGYVTILTQNAMAVARFTPDGHLDSGFGTFGKSIPDLGLGSETAADITLQPDGKIILAGMNNDVMVARLKTDGSIDSSFGSNGRVTASFGPNSPDRTKCVAIQPWGRIIVGLAAEESFAAIAFNTEFTIGVKDISVIGETHSIYPNPSDGIIRVKGLENGQFNILDAFGRSVLQGYFEHEIDLSSLQPGLYSIQLSTGDKVEVLKLLKS